MDRRRFLTSSAALTAGAWASTLWTPGLSLARARTADVASGTGREDLAREPSGTTLERTLLPSDGSGYRRLVEAPGWPIVVREELQAPTRPGREGRRRALASIVHLTDVHTVDAQSPARVEFLDRYADPTPGAVGAVSSAWRPQETACGQIADAMVRQVAEVGAGPVTGRAFDAAVATGDSTDNHQANELDWFLATMDGGRMLTVNSGDPARYEGIQDDEPTSYDEAYWHPGGERGDDYQDRYGFPVSPGLLDAVIAPFVPVGLPCPWYSVYGNHDGLVQGNAPDNAVIEAIATGPLKVVGTPDELSPASVQDLVTEQRLAELLGGSVVGLAELDALLAQAQLQAPARVVTPDEQRAFLSRRGWVEAHRRDRGGPGPRGHGLDADAAETGDLHYTLDLDDDVLGICLDTVDPGGYANGSLDRAQFAWLAGELAGASSRHLDADGNTVRTGNDDRLVVLFAHHGLESLNNPTPDPERPAEPRVLADELEALLHRFPNVIAFVTGHTHVNRAIARPDPAGRSGGFWEVTTAAHIDAPQHSRVVEVVDNRDGTISVFGALLDHAGPVRAPATPTSPLELASFARELAFNDPQNDVSGAIGEPSDRNVELLLQAPFSRRA